MKKEQKKNIKLAAKEGLNLALSKLMISELSSKTEAKLKKISKKLIGQLKDEVRKQEKRNNKKAKKSRSIKAVPSEQLMQA